jgi:dihydrodipicolinate synthase/N-acetylneuraminate lyase
MDNLNLSALHKLITTFLSQGIGGLAHSTGAGRGPKLSTKQHQQMIEFVEHHPPLLRRS